MKHRLAIVGTSHVALESKKRIKEEFARLKPDIIAIELDRNRFAALMSKEKQSLGLSMIRRLGLTGYIFAVIGRIIQKKLGDIAGMNPGEDMLLGAELAKNNNLMLALIDQDASITLSGLSKKVKLSEKLRIFFDILLSPFSKREKIKFDITKIPKEELIARLLEQMKDRYPGFYRVLLDDRNRFMAKKIFIILKSNPEKKVLAIVGAGHVKGLNEHLDSLFSSNIY